MLVFEERGKPEYPKKNLSEQSRGTNNKLNPHMTPAGSGNRTRDTLVGGELLISARLLRKEELVKLPDW